MKRKNIITLCLILLLFIASFCIILSNQFSNNKNTTKDEELIGTYIDGQYSENIPNKDTGYVVEKIVCDNNAVGKWDYDNWGITLTNLSKKNKCNIHFRKGVKLADTINLVDTTGKCPTVNDDGSVNVTSAESENSLLCSAPDNYGNSYYFRGNVQNNYVKFANFYWRIVRINGDGSIRMIYDGTTAHENGETSEDRIIGTSAYNENYNDNAYVGYMYGTPGSSTYEETHANINDSTIKKYIDTWYENNLKNTKYEEYINDNLFCNDRTLDAGSGFGTNTTGYRWANQSIFNSDYSFSNVSFTPFICSKNNSFSVEKTTGNGNLHYMIGLTTTPEIIMSGGTAGYVTKYYIYSGQTIWTMSAYYFNSYASVRTVLDGANAWFDSKVSNINGVKPVINLKSNSLVSGDGTINNPYTVE